MTNQYPDRRAYDTIETRAVRYHIITALISGLAVFLGFQTDLLNVRNDMVTTLMDRIEYLEQRESTKSGEMMALRGEIVNLRAQVQHKGDPLDALFNYIGALGKPAWLKVYRPESDQFTMLYINGAYEREYARTASFYIGKTDFDVWPQDIAQRFYDNDMRTLSRRDFNETIEIVKKDGEEKTVQVWKWYTRLPDGRHAIAGIQNGT